MISQLSSGDLISDRYASALYDLAADSKKVDTVLKDLKLLKECIEKNKDLKLLTKSPLIASNDKLKIFEKILSNQSVSKLTINFLKVISKNKRFANLFSIILEFVKINSYKRGNIQADVISSEKLLDNQKNKIKDQLKSILGEKISLNFNVDKKIIGGLIVKVGSKMVDSSIATKINKLKIVMREA